MKLGSWYSISILNWNSVERWKWNKTLHYILVLIYSSWVFHSKRGNKEWKLAEKIVVLSHPSPPQRWPVFDVILIENQISVSKEYVNQNVFGSDWNKQPKCNQSQVYFTFRIQHRLSNLRVIQGADIYYLSNPTSSKKGHIWNRMNKPKLQLMKYNDFDINIPELILLTQVFHA